MEITVYIHASWNKWAKKFEFSASESEDLTFLDQIKVSTHQITFESPVENDLRLAIRKVLLASRNKILADAYVKAEKVQQEADELLALEYKSESSKDD